jgi:hypothetical protein
MVAQPHIQHARITLSLELFERVLFADEVVGTRDRKRSRDLGGSLDANRSWHCTHISDDIDGDGGLFAELLAIRQHGSGNEQRTCLATAP